MDEITNLVDQIINEITVDEINIEADENLNQTSESQQTQINTNDNQTTNNQTTNNQTNIIDHENILQNFFSGSGIPLRRPIVQFYIPQINSLDDEILNRSFQEQEKVKKPLSKEYLENIEKIEYCDSDNKITCSICLDELKSGEKVIKLPCKSKTHFFHFDKSETCDGILPWFEENNTCPICRTEYPEEKTINVDNDINNNNNNDDNPINQNQINLDINNILQFSMNTYLNQPTNIIPLEPIHENINTDDNNLNNYNNDNDINDNNDNENLESQNISSSFIQNIPINNIFGDINQLISRVINEERNHMMSEEEELQRVILNSIENQ